MCGVCGVCGNVARSCSCYREEKTVTLSSAKTTAKKTKTTKKHKSKTHADEPPLAVATSEYDYSAPSSVYLSLSVGCEVRELSSLLPPLPPPPPPAAPASPAAPPILALVIAQPA